jgi:hypothetical protein
VTSETRTVFHFEVHPDPDVLGVFHCGVAVIIELFSHSAGIPNCIDFSARSTLTEIFSMPVATASVPTTVLHAGEFGVFPQWNLNLHIPNVRNGVVAISENGLFHVVAAHFVSPIDAWKAVAALSDKAEPLHVRRIGVDLIYLSSGQSRLPGYARLLPRRMPTNAFNADVFAHDLQQAFSGVSPEKVLASGDLNSNVFKSVLIPIDTQAPYTIRPSGITDSQYSVEPSHHSGRTSAGHEAVVQEFSVTRTNEGTQIRLEIPDVTPPRSRRATPVRAISPAGPMVDISRSIDDTSGDWMLPDL